MALTGLYCADVSFSNYSLTHLVYITAGLSNLLQMVNRTLWGLPKCIHKCTSHTSMYTYDYHIMYIPYISM